MGHVSDPPPRFVPAFVLGATHDVCLAQKAGATSTSTVVRARRLTHKHIIAFAKSVDSIIEMTSIKIIQDGFGR